MCVERKEKEQSQLTPTSFLELGLAGLTWYRPTRERHLTIHLRCENNDPNQLRIHLPGDGESPKRGLMSVVA